MREMKKKIAELRKALEDQIRKDAYEQLAIIDEDVLQVSLDFYELGYRAGAAEVMEAFRFEFSESLATMLIRKEGKPS